MDDLLSTPPPSSPPGTAFKPLPTNPHSLVGSSSPTFPLAVKMYHELLTRAATRHEERRQMGNNAHLVASKRSWFSAMEMLINGYREVVAKAESDTTSLSRTSTVEFDIVTEDAKEDKIEEIVKLPQRRRKLAKMKRLRQSSRALLTFSDDKETQALCGELFSLLSVMVSQS